MRPPSSTPEADSINVVTVEVPVHAPTQVARESASIALFISGISPFSFNIFAFFAVPFTLIDFLQPLKAFLATLVSLALKVMLLNFLHLRNAEDGIFFSCLFKVMEVAFAPLNAFAPIAFTVYDAPFLSFTVVATDNFLADLPFFASPARVTVPFLEEATLVTLYL